MSAGTLPRVETANYPGGHMELHNDRKIDPDWMRIGVGATLLTGSLLLLTGKHKAGLALTGAGAALAMLEHKEVVRGWWDSLPGYLDHAQKLLDQATATIEDLTAKRNKVMSLLGK